MTLVIAFICLAGFQMTWIWYVVVFVLYSLSLALRISRTATMNTKFAGLESSIMILRNLRDQR